MVNNGGNACVFTSTCIDEKTALFKCTNSDSGTSPAALRAILERRDLLAAVAKRRDAIRAALTEQGQLSPALDRCLAACTSMIAMPTLS